jgi:phosphonate metabolism protein PhnN/1,5-bisphosphokinase (PRPP-forming)
MHQPRRSSRSRSATVDATTQAGPGPMGRLVLVVGGEQAGLDVLLTAARRRFAAESGFEFPVRLTTRRRPAGATEMSMSRRVFREIERDGGLLLSWESDGVLHGYPISVREALAAGRMVVASAPALVVPEAVGRWPDVRVVQVTVGTDAARLPLRPRTCLARMTGVKPLQRSGAPFSEDRVDAFVHHSGSLSLSVRSLTDSLHRVLSEPQRARPSRARPQPRKRAGAQPSTAGVATPPG